MSLSTQREKILPPARCDHSAIMFKDKMFMFGGKNLQ